MGYTRYVFMALTEGKSKKLQSCKYIKALHALHYNYPSGQKETQDRVGSPYSFRDQGLRCEQGCRSDTINAIHLSKQTNLLTVVEAHGEGNGNPLQCSCLENPRDGGAWWAAVYGVVQSGTRLKRLSSSTSSSSKSSTSNRHSSSCGWILTLTYSTKIYKPNSY